MGESSRRTTISPSIRPLWLDWSQSPPGSQRELVNSSLQVLWWTSVRQSIVSVICLTPGSWTGWSASEMVGLLADYPIFAQWSTVTLISRIHLPRTPAQDPQDPRWGKCRVLWWHIPVWHQCHSQGLIQSTQQHFNRDVYMDTNVMVIMTVKLEFLPSPWQTCLSASVPAAPISSQIFSADLQCVGPAAREILTVEAWS